MYRIFDNESSMYPSGRISFWQQTGGKNNDIQL